MGKIRPIAAINCDVRFEFRVLGGEPLGHLHEIKDAVPGHGVLFALQPHALTGGPRGVEGGAGLGEIGDGDGFQPSLAISTATSLMRFEKPHSLSYQESTRTKTPSITWVWVKSKVELAGLWLKSMETSGSL